MTNAKIQVGEYVKTKNHGIFKVLKLYETESKYYILNNDKYETYTIGGSSRFDISKDIINHDFDIIKLIEVGDYVNGNKVIKKHNNYLMVGTEFINQGISNELIETVVTKEQFKSMEYEVGKNE